MIVVKIESFKYNIALKPEMTQAKIQRYDGATCVAYKIPRDELVDRIENGLRFLKDGSMANPRRDAPAHEFAEALMLDAMSTAYAKKTGIGPLVEAVREAAANGRDFREKDNGFGGAILGLNLIGYPQGDDYVVAFALIPDSTPDSTVDGLSAAIGSEPVEFPRGM